MQKREVAAKRLGAAFKAAREQAGLTQAEAAERVGESRDTVAKWDQGRHAPEILKVPGIEEAYDLPAGWIFRHAGLLADVAEWPLDEIIASDPSLPEERTEIAALVRRLLGAFPTDTPRSA